jgi:hypothetical protein
MRVTLLTSPLLNSLRVARPAAPGCAACGRPWSATHDADSQPLACERCGVVMDVDCYRRHVAVTPAEQLWWMADDDWFAYIQVLCRGCRQ